MRRHLRGSVLLCLLAGCVEVRDETDAVRLALDQKLLEDILVGGTYLSANLVVARDWAGADEVELLALQDASWLLSLKDLCVLYDQPAADEFAHLVAGGVVVGSEESARLLNPLAFAELGEGDCPFEGLEWGESGSALPMTWVLYVRPESDTYRFVRIELEDRLAVGVDEALIQVDCISCESVPAEEVMFMIGD